MNKVVWFCFLKLVYLICSYSIVLVMLWVYSLHLRWKSAAISSNAASAFLLFCVSTHRNARNFRMASTMLLQWEATFRGCDIFGRISCRQI
jgi:hypothetical protein